MYDGKCIQHRLCVSSKLLKEALGVCDQMKDCNRSLKENIEVSRNTLDRNTISRDNMTSGTIQADRVPTKNIQVGWDVELDIDLT